MNSIKKNCYFKLMLTEITYKNIFVSAQKHKIK